MNCTCVCSVSSAAGCSSSCLLWLCSPSLAVFFFSASAFSLSSFSCSGSGSHWRVKKSYCSSGVGMYVLCGKIDTKAFYWVFRENIFQIFPTMTHCIYIIKLNEHMSSVKKPLEMQDFIGLLGRKFQIFSTTVHLIHFIYIMMLHEHLDSWWLSW